MSSLLYRLVPASKMRPWFSCTLVASSPAKICLLRLAFLLLFHDGFLCASWVQLAMMVASLVATQSLQASVSVTQLKILPSSSRIAKHRPKNVWPVVGVEMPIRHVLSCSRTGATAFLMNSSSTKFISSMMMTWASKPRTVYMATVGVS